MLSRNLIAAGAMMAQVVFAGAASAQTSAFEDGWTLSNVGSNLHFISVKKGSVMESSKFAALAGTIDETGKATLEVALDSVDTAVDLRNVRMRFLLFETFLHPTATITTNLSESMLDGLLENGSLTMDLPFELDLHGVKQALEAEVIVTAMGEHRVSIASAEPVILKLEDFNLMEGRAKLQDAAEVDITPATSVLFHLVFDRNGTRDAVVLASADISQRPALEPVGRLDRDACVGRFEILSRSGNINFEPNSAELTQASAPILKDVSNVLQRCPDFVVRVAGHTDSLGNSAYNLELSRQRSQSVVSFLKQTGIPSDRLVSRGFGETRPIASNKTFEGRLANRRIEFSVERVVGDS